MSYLFLTLIMIVFLVIAIRYLKFDFISPQVVTYIVYIISLLSAIIGLLSWNSIGELDGRLYIIFILAFVGVLLGGFLAKKINYKKNDNYNLLRIRKIDNKKLIICTLVIICTIICVFLDLKRIYFSINGYNTNNILKLITTYRENSELFNANSAKLGLTFSRYTSFLIKASNVICTCYLFIFINNLIKKVKFKNNYINLIPVVVNIFLGYCQSGRGAVVKLVLIAICEYLIIMIKRKKLKKIDFKDKKVIKNTFKIVGIGTLVIVLFYLSLPLFGRSTDKNFIEYISFYLGSPIPTFSKLLSVSPNIHSDMFGRETLYSIYRVLNKIGITNSYKAISLEFIYFDGMGSNVYTALRRYFVDFGLLGVFFCSFISGFGYSVMYNLAVKMKNIKFLLFYSFFFSYIFDQFRDELFFTSFINTATITYFILFNLVAWFIFKWKGIKKWKILRFR